MGKRTAVSVMKDGWYTLGGKVPSAIYKKFKKILIDSDVGNTDVINSFCYAIISGDIIVEKISNERFVDTGLLDTYRVLLKDRSGKVLNPTPIPNSFLD